VEELSFIVPNGLGHPDGEVIFSARECGNLGVLVSDGPEWEGTGSQHLSPGQTRAWRLPASAGKRFLSSLL